VDLINQPIKSEELKNEYEYEYKIIIMNKIKTKKNINNFNIYL